MESIIIVAKRGFELEQLRRAIPSEFSVDEAANGRIVIERDGRRAYLGTDALVVDELEPEEASRLLRMMPDPIFYTLDFSDISLCKELLIAIADRSDVIVDNDHGVVLPGSEYVRILRSQIDWDWRKEASLGRFVP
jgi:hypothetical protein